MFARDHSRRRSGRPAAAQIDTIAGYPCRHRPLEGQRAWDLDAVDRRHPGSAGRRTLCQPVQPRPRSYEVIQQVPLTPGALTRYYVHRAAGQPVLLSNLVTLKTAIGGGGKAVIGWNVKLAAAGALLDVPLGHKAESWSSPHFDTITVSVADASRPDEILVVMAIADGGRLHIGAVPSRSDRAEIRSR